jgi:alpha-ketoglutaric semialdehyde dehydrogenase
LLRTFPETTVEWFGVNTLRIGGRWPVANFEFPRSSEETFLKPGRSCHPAGVIPMKIEGFSIIGLRRGSLGGKTFGATNPATATILPGEFHSATTAEVETAAQQARTAFAEYSRWSGEARLALLERIAAQLEANAAAIVARAHLETALAPARLNAELARTCDQLRFYGAAAASGLGAGVRIDHADLQRQPFPKPDIRSMFRPLGPVVVFGASNFPLAYSVAGGDTASALAAGCAVIVKAHPAHPGTSEIVGQLIQQAVREMNAPAGLFSLLFDAGYEVGAALVQHPLVKAVGFTGSLAGGRALLDLAAARPEPIPVYAEMSSLNPIFITATALAQRGEAIAVGLYNSVTSGLGQFCTKPGLVFVEAGTGAKSFLAKLQSLMEATATGPMLTAGLCASYQVGTAKYLATPGVKCAARVDFANSAVPATAGATLFVTDAATFLGNHHLMAEVFGPATLVVECNSRDQMQTAARALEGQLTASLHATADEVNMIRELLEIVTTKAGRLIYNGFPTGVEVGHAMTHGGPYPATSDGRSSSVGTRALDRFLRPVSYQNFPDAALPPELQEANPLQLERLVDGKLVFGQ